MLFFLPGKLSTIYHLANPTHSDPGLSTTSLKHSLTYSSKSRSYFFTIST